MSDIRPTKEVLKLGVIDRIEADDRLQVLVDGDVIWESDHGRECVGAYNLLLELRRRGLIQLEVT